MAGRAHSVRPQSCDSPSSPEPSASLFGEGASTEGAELGLRAPMGGFGMGGRVSRWPTRCVDATRKPHHDADVRTTINISDGILSELHERARQRRRPFREILEETIQLGLSAMPPSSKERARIETHRVGIKPAYRGLSMNQLYDQIEAEDGGKR